MGKANLRKMMDAFADNVKEELPATLSFDGKRLYLITQVSKGKVGMTDDLRDDTVYRLVGDDIDEVAREMGVRLTEVERGHVQKGVEEGFGSSWHDIIESAIDDVVASRRES